jgi:hypothetical protein
MLAGRSVAILWDCNIANIFLIIKFIRERNIIIKSLFRTEFYLCFSKYKSAGMNITNYVVTLFKYEIITDIQCTLKAALYPILINEMSGTVFLH